MVNFKIIDHSSAFFKTVSSRINNHCFIFVNFSLSLTTYQNGFMSKWSVCCNLAFVKQIIFQSVQLFETNSQIDEIYTDLFAAFESINHEILFKNYSYSGSLTLYFPGFVLFFPIAAIVQVINENLNFKAISFNVLSGVP